MQEKTWNDYLEIKCAKYLIHSPSLGFGSLSKHLAVFWFLIYNWKASASILVWPTKVETHWLVCSAASWATLWLCSPQIWQFVCQICMSQFEALDLNCQFRWWCFGFLQIQSNNTGFPVTMKAFTNCMYFFVQKIWNIFRTAGYPLALAKNVNITLLKRGPLIFQSRRVFPNFRIADKLPAMRGSYWPEITSSPTRTDINIIKIQAHYLSLFDKRDAN